MSHELPPPKWGLRIVKAVASGNLTDGRCLRLYKFKDAAFHFARSGESGFQSCHPDLKARSRYLHKAGCRDLGRPKQVMTAYKTFIPDAFDLGRSSIDHQGDDRGNLEVRKTAYSGVRLHIYKAVPPFPQPLGTAKARRFLYHAPHDYVLEKQRNILPVLMSSNGACKRE